ncbi:Gfo/Idh/MocA family oxidoreductase [Natronoflexus pectinivorans]|uniref:Putative dehydrogenase n=1 Tax=Natronoflexus pectinivorans TaxID=682526 RepID=A0A4R2GK00_9BACT|nr:Gfo/Idh/MocA family oxidoreductase [Natronoflexus pectinivorans]TCO09134.1 putative dehydrogenase [Natronoflexus pectinivorans]
MSNPIITAIASYGMSGQVFHGPLLKINSGFRVKSIMQRSSNSALSVFPNAKIVRSFNDIINDKEIELVVVNTPDHLHFEQAKMALNAGKHVVVEKPFVQTTEQGEELIELAQKQGVLLSVFQNRRWDNSFLTVKRVLDEGLIGRLVEYEARYNRYRTYIQDSWKEDGNLGTGILQNLGSHLIDQALVLFGKPESVSGNLHAMRDGSKVHDFFDLRLNYSGVSVTLKASYLVREEMPAYMLHGVNGSFIKYGLDPQEEALKNGHLPNEPAWGTDPQNLWGLLNSDVSGLHFRGNIETVAGNYSAYYDNLHQSIRFGSESAVKPQESLEGIRIIEEVLRMNI